MVKKKVNRKALALSTVVGLILLILGFAILILAFTQINWTGEVNREVCHQSVIYRATLPSFAGMKEYVPLKCKTDKICITTGIIGGKCSEYKNVEGITYARVSDIEDVEQVIAKEIVSCWETMGEGKVSLFNDWFVQTYGFGSVTSSCVICSRIAYDKDALTKAGIDLSKMDVQKYMMTHRAPNKEVSYFIYLTGSGGLMSVKDSGGKVNFDNVVSENNKYNVRTEQIELSSKSEVTDSSKELSVMFMQVQAPQYKDILKNNLYTLVGVGGGSYVVAPKYATKAATVLGKSPWFWAVLAVVGVYQYNSVRENQAFTASKCGDITAGDKATTGCSVVRTVNYGAEDLSQYCSKIESIS